MAEIQAASLKYGFWADGIQTLQIHLMARSYAKTIRQNYYLEVAAFQAEAVRLLKAENSCLAFLDGFADAVSQRLFFDSPWSSRMMECPDWVEGACVVWMQSEVLWFHRKKWLSFFKHHREAVRSEWMSEDERTHLMGLSNPVPIYRGYNKPHAKKGFSWSLSKEVACAMPTRPHRGTPNPWLVTAEICPSAIIVFLNSRREQEVVALPRDIKVISEEPIMAG